MCLEKQLINSYVDKQLKEPYLTQVKQHLESCSACNEIYEKYNKLSLLMHENDLSDLELEESKKRVLEHVDQNKGKKSKFIKQQLTINLPMFVTAAAAFVVVFVGAFFFMGNYSTQTLENIPSIELNQNAALVPVSNTIEIKKDLSKFSDKDIIKEMEKRGYKVTLNSK